MRRESGHLAVLRNKNGRREILLVQRRDVPMWIIPGGIKEISETYEEATLREFKEETGYKGRIDTLAAVYKSEDGHVEKRLFVGRVIGGEKKLGPESRKVKWFPTNNLPRGLTLYETQRIRDALNFNGEVTHRLYKVSVLREGLHQLKNPLFFLQLFFYAIIRATRRGGLY